MLNFFRNLRRNIKSWESFIQAGHQALESNKYTEAKEAFDEALRKAEDDGQEESIATTLMWLARMYHRQQQYAEAVSHLQRALIIWEKTAGGHNQPLVQVLTGLGLCYIAQEKFEEAIEFLTRALVAVEGFEVVNELNLADILKRLSWAHCAQGNYVKAESLCRRALSIQENLKEADSGEVVDIILTLIICCRRQQRLQEVDVLLARLLEILRQAGFDPATLAINISAAGQKLLHEHRYGAEDVLSNALLIRVRTLDPHHRDIAMTLNDLGLLYWEQSRYGEAEQVFTRAMGIYSIALGPEDCFVGMTHLNLALLFQDIERNDEADAHFLRALSIAERASGTAPENLLPDILQHYAGFLRKLNRSSEAETFEGRARNPIPLSASRPSEAPAPEPTITAPEAAPAVSLSTVTLYQPDKVLEQRLGSTATFSSFLRAAIAETDAYWSALPRSEAQSAELVVAIRPGGRARFWFEFSLRSNCQDEITGLMSRLSTLTVPEVHGGPVAAVLHLSVRGGLSTNRAADSEPYIPVEWREAAKNSGTSLVVPDDILAIVWPE